MILSWPYTKICMIRFLQKVVCNMNEIQLNLDSWSLSPAFVEVFLRGTVSLMPNVWISWTNWWSTFKIKFYRTAWNAVCMLEMFATCIEEESPQSYQWNKVITTKQMWCASLGWPLEIQREDKKARFLNRKANSIIQR